MKNLLLIFGVVLVLFSLSCTKDDKDPYIDTNGISIESYNDSTITIYSSLNKELSCKVTYSFKLVDMYDHLIVKRYQNQKKIKEICYHHIPSFKNYFERGQVDVFISYFFKKTERHFWIYYWNGIQIEGNLKE